MSSSIGSSPDAQLVRATAIDAHGSSPSSGERYAMRKASHVASSTSEARATPAIRPGCTPRWIAGQLVQAGRREGDLVGQARGVERAAQAGQQLVLVAVVGGAGHAADAQVAGAVGGPAPRGGRARRARGRPTRLGRLPLPRLARADGAGGFEST